MSLVCRAPAVLPGETEWIRTMEPVLTLDFAVKVVTVVPLVPKASSLQTAPEGSTGIAVVLLAMRLLPVPLTATSDTSQPGRTAAGTVTPELCTGRGPRPPRDAVKLISEFWSFHGVLSL